MRILHVPHVYTPITGGLTYFCSQISQQLHQLGHEVEVLVPDIPYPTAFSQYGAKPIAPPYSVINGISVTRIPFCGTLQYKTGERISKIVKSLRWQRLYWYFVYTTTRKIGEYVATSFVAKKIEQFRPDVVVTMAHFYPNMQWVLQLHRKNHFPLVQIPLLHEHHINTAQGYALSQGNAIISLTNAEAEFLRRSYGLPTHSTFVGSIGTEVPDSAKSEKENYVLFLGRKEPYKGIQETVAAMRHVWQTFPHLRLVLVGPRTPSSGFLDELLSNLTSSERTNVTEIEQVSHQEKNNLLQNALCLIFASKSESFGLVLIEAMALSTPAITWNIPIFREIIDHEETGLLVEEDNRIALGEAILRLAQNPDWAQNLGKRGHEVAKAKYRWEEVIKNYVSAYNYAINNSLTKDQESNNHSF